MIKIDDKEYRNLEEQVLDNTNSIQSIIEGNLVLSELGIRVVGKVSTPEDLPDPEFYDGIFGDAILVGNTSPYNYYIFTRPFTPDGTNQWFNIGKFPVAGPRGQTGPTGAPGRTGERGTKWFSGPTLDPAVSTYKEGDMWIISGLNPTSEALGNVYQVINGAWTLITNIRGKTGPAGPQGREGPQGPAGPQGPQGPAGPVSSPVQIDGELTSIDQLPDPYSVPRNAAYLVRPSSDVPADLYIIVGDTDNLEWIDTGGFGYGTQVYSGGQPVEEWNADTKMNMPPAGHTFRVPSSKSDLSISWDLRFSTSAVPAYLAQRDSHATGGQINAPNQETYPPETDQYISKRFGDKNYIKKFATNSKAIIAMDPSGDITTFTPAYGAITGTIPLRSGVGGIQLTGPNQETAPPADDEYITKRYADNNYVSKTENAYYMHDITIEFDPYYNSIYRDSAYFKLRVIMNSNTPITDLAELADRVGRNGGYVTYPCVKASELDEEGSENAYMYCNIFIITQYGMIFTQENDYFALVGESAFATPIEFDNSDYRVAEDSVTAL